MVAKYLMKKEKIDGDEFEDLMTGKLTEADFTEQIASEAETEETSSEENKDSE